ncbi:MAG: hypothetical protein NC485_14435 [Ruminococcus flavefaciens]|nr:hypothetical protein [Ruminococcus flavefaciens]
MCSYYNSYYGETTHSDGSKSYYNSYYGETSNSDGSKSYYNDYYGTTNNGDGSSSYYNGYYGETYGGDGSKSYYNGYYGGSSSYYSGSDYSSNDDNSGGGCYISTACIKAKGFSDDCFELSILRKYRDKLVEEDTEIRRVVKEYYNAAPKLIAVINRQPDKQRIYEYIYDNLVVLSIKYLIEEDYQRAVAQYRKIYEELKKKYCA